jgi:hypothetical protein
VAQQAAPVSGCTETPKRATTAATTRRRLLLRSACILPAFSLRGRVRAPRISPVQSTLVLPGKKSATRPTIYRIHPGFLAVNPSYSVSASHPHQNKQPNSLYGSQKLTMTQKSFFGLA